MKHDEGKRRARSRRAEATPPSTASVTPVWSRCGRSVDLGSGRPPLVAQWPHGHHTARTRSPGDTAAAAADNRNRSAAATRRSTEAAG